jgi:DNA-binding transcriptional regulator GbsR (MarR family)
MHQNIVTAQSKIIQLVKSNLEILECPSKKPIVMATLKISEKPLTIEEISQRAELSEDEVKNEIECLMNKGFLKKFPGSEVYDFNPEILKIMMAYIYEKVDKINKNVLQTIGEVRILLYENPSEHSDCDHLMAKYLNDMLMKGEMIHTMVRQKLEVMNLLKSHMKQE